MSISTLPLCYCTNVHPGRTVSDVVRGVSDYTAEVQRRTGGPLAAGLWLAAPVIRELCDSAEGATRLRDDLAELNLSCHTLNAFPYGDFHSPRVKENVYLPDWSDPRRLDYTRDCAHVLATLLPAGGEGSISTLPLGFKGFSHPEGHRRQCLEQLLQTATDLAKLESETGRLIRLAIEPEPFCLLETTPETLAFFAELWDLAGQRKRLDIARRHLGVCYDVCHQSVEFEDVPASIRALDAAEIRINKVHITCALELRNPAANSAGREALARYVEERYLHQTLARNRAGRIARCIDLTTDVALHPDAEFRDADVWRIHFHVPVDCEQLGPLGTTRADLRQALSAVAGLSYAPHLEVETYTWEVLPDAAGAPRKLDLATGLTREIEATRLLLESRL